MAELVYRDRDGRELPARELAADALLGHHNPALVGDEKHLEVTLAEGRTATRLSVPAGDGPRTYFEKRARSIEHEHTHKEA